MKYFKIRTQIRLKFQGFSLTLNRILTLILFYYVSQQSIFNWKCG
jgi:hypothetical protein